MASRILAVVCFFCLAHVASSGVEQSKLLDLISKVLHEEHGLDKTVLPLARPVSLPGRATGGTDGQSTMVRNGLQEPSLRIAAFNIQIFGDRKYKNTEVVNYLVKILLRYDLIFVQEIRDSDGSSFPQLMDDLNIASGENGGYDYIISQRLGRSSSKEQYAYVYKRDRLSVSNQFQYKESQVDVFEREPYAVKFTSDTTDVKEFGVIGIHTKPTKAVEEIDGLSHVLDVVEREFNVENIILMGDFNADCSYVRKGDWEHIHLRSDSSLLWLISDNSDTTVAKSECAYDRLILHGEELKKILVPNSGKIFNFTEEYHMSHMMAEDVSDHYPIEMELYGKVHGEVKNSMSTSSCFSVVSRVPITDEGGLDILLGIADPAESAGFDLEILLHNNDQTQYIVAAKTNLDIRDLVPSLLAFREEFKTLLSHDVISVAQSYLEDAKFFESSRTVAGFPVPRYPVYDVRLEYRYMDPKTYKLTISQAV